MLLLSLDTSTRGCSVALQTDGQLLAGYDIHTDRSSSAMLTTLIRNVVNDAGYSLHDLDAVAVAKGPGSYTGLRVGISTAKGLCYAIDRPLIAINTLEAMSLQVQPFYTGSTLLCPMIDARRMEVYAAVLDCNGHIVEPTQAVILNESSFSHLLESHPVVFFGDGAAKCQKLFSDNLNAIFPSQEIRPSARTVGQLAYVAFTEGHFEDVASFEPYYLKDFMSPPQRKTSPLA